MTFIWRTADGTAPIDSGSTTFTIGWTRAAIAVHSLMQMPVPMFLRLEVDEHPPIIIDFRHNAFVWARAMESFPSSPKDVRVETEPTSYEAPPIFALPGRSLDSLLWEIGRHSFIGTATSWMRPGDRYKLVRWPDFTEQVLTLTHMRMTAMLGNGYLDANELAAAAGVDEGEAQTLLNAFSLMGILQSSMEEAANPVLRAIEAA